MEKNENKSHEFALIDAIEAIDNYFVKYNEGWNVGNPSPSVPSNPSDSAWVTIPSTSTPNYDDGGLEQGGGMQVETPATPDYDYGGLEQGGGMTVETPATPNYDYGGLEQGGGMQVTTPTPDPVPNYDDVSLEQGGGMQVTTPTPDPAPPPAGTDVGIGDLGTGTDRITGNVGAGVTVGGVPIGAGNIIPDSDPDPDPSPPVLGPSGPGPSGPGPSPPGPGPSGPGPSPPGPSGPGPGPSPPVQVAPPLVPIDTQVAQLDSASSSAATAACAD